MEPQYSIGIYSKEPLTIVVFDGVDNFKAIINTPDCDGILFTPTNGKRMIEQLVARYSSDAKHDDGNTIIISRSSVAHRIVASFKASAICMGNMTISDKMTVVLERFDPDAIPVSIAEEHAFAKALKMEVAATSDTLQSQSSVIAALGARIAELSMTVDKMCVAHETSEKTIKQLQARAKVYDAAQVLPSFRYSFFEKHPNGMPRVPMIIGKLTYSDGSAIVVHKPDDTTRSIHDLPAIVRYMDMGSSFSMPTHCPFDLKCTVLVVPIDRGSTFTKPPAMMSKTRIKHIVFVSNSAGLAMYCPNGILNPSYRVDVVAWTNIGVKVHVNQYAEKFVPGYNTIVDFNYDQPNAMTTWSAIISLAQSEYDKNIAAWKAIESEFVDAYLSGML